MITQEWPRARFTGVFPTHAAEYTLRSFRRYIMELEPSLESHFELETLFAPTGNFKIELEFNTASFGDQYLLDGNSTDPRLSVMLLADGTIQTAAGVVTIDGNTTYLDPRDGYAHKLVVTGVTSTLSVEKIGIGFDNSNPFNGYLYNLALRDIDVPSNTQTYKLDRPTGSTELSSGGAYTLTYNNIPEHKRHLQGMSDVAPLFIPYYIYNTLEVFNTLEIYTNNGE